MGLTLLDQVPILDLPLRPDYNFWATVFSARKPKLHSALRLPFCNENHSIVYKPL